MAWITASRNASTPKEDYEYLGALLRQVLTGEPCTVEQPVQTEWVSQTRCSTWIEAEEMHKRIVASLKQASDEVKQLVPEPLPEAQ